MRAQRRDESVRNRGPRKTESIQSQAALVGLESVPDEGGLRKDRDTQSLESFERRSNSLANLYGRAESRRTFVPTNKKGEEASAIVTISFCSDS